MKESNGTEYALGSVGAEQDSVSESANLVDKQHRVNLKTAVHYRLAILILSWATIFILGGLGVATFVLAVKDNSSAAFAFGLDALLDCLSSIVVIWRYGGQSNTLYSSYKENVACITLAILFFLSAASITCKAIIALAAGIKAERLSILRYIFIVNGTVCTLFVVGKFYLGYKLESKAIITDAFNSLIGAVLAYTMLFGELAYETDKTIWLLDNTVGIICAVILVIYGMWILLTAIRELRLQSKGQPVQE